jgi:hypothetical protein
VRAELEQVSEGEGSPERAIELLGELSELAKAVEEELTKAQRAAELEASPAEPASPGGEDRPPSGGPGESDAQS